MKVQLQIGLAAAALCNGMVTVSAAELAGVPAAVRLPAAAPRFDIQRYELVNTTLLSSNELARAVAGVGGTGTNLTLGDIRRALVAVQQAFRDQGHGAVGVRLEQQPLTNGVARLRVLQEAQPNGVPERRLERWVVPGFAVRHFEIRGNTALSAEEIDRTLSPAATASSTADELKAALQALREAYVAKGHALAVVRVPRQVLSDGTVVIEVVEGVGPVAQAREAERGKVPVPARAPEPAFKVREYEVVGNTLLKPEVLSQVFTNATGDAVTLATIRKALGELQLAYRDRGYATVSVALPQQQLTNAVVRVQVTEGILSHVRVSGNRFFSSNNVMRALPSLRTNVLLNSRVFQRELDIANQNRDRQIYPTLGAGPEPGTSSLSLQVKDRLPLHGRVELNNHATPGTPEWRVNASLQYNNLWQQEHQAGLSYGFSPEAFKTPGLVEDNLFNRPLIANYGAYYRLPLGRVESVEEKLQRSAGFGYDEATRQFRVPPAGGRADVTVYASSSSTDTGVKFSPARVVSQTPLLTIVSQDSGQNLSLNDTVGARFSLPLVPAETRRFVVSAGLDLKRYSLESFNTNNFIITTVVTNAQGSQTIESRVASPQPRRFNSVDYLPLSVGLDYLESDKTGNWSAAVAASYNVLGEAAEFAPLAYSGDVRGGFGKATLSVTREQRITGEWSVFARAGAQGALDPMISNEQFAIGGLATIRGYFEGDEYGDAGWYGGLELRSPYLRRELPLGSGAIPVWLRGAAFLDLGQRFLLDDAVTEPSRFLWGTGLGVSASFNNRVDLRVTVGWPLADSANTPAGSPRSYLSLGGQF